MTITDAEPNFQLLRFIHGSKLRPSCPSNSVEEDQHNTLDPSPIARSLGEGPSVNWQAKTIDHYPTLVDYKQLPFRHEKDHTFGITSCYNRYSLLGLQQGRLRQTDTRRGKHRPRNRG